MDFRNLGLIVLEGKQEYEQEYKIVYVLLTPNSESTPTHNLV